MRSKKQVRTLDSRIFEQVFKIDSVPNNNNNSITEIVNRSDEFSDARWF